MVQVKGLDGFAKSFADALFVAFPWMRAHATVDPHDQFDPGALWVTLSPPPIRQDCRLWISTHAGVVTIGFGMFHSHFDWPRPDDDACWEEPLDFIQALSEDRVLIEDWTRNGKCTGSSTLDRGTAPDLSGMKLDDVVMIRSWSSLPDRKILGTPDDERP